MPSPKRRLPVLKANDGDPAPPRPRWQWVGFGAVAILVAWLPLAYASQALVDRWVEARLGAEATLVFSRPIAPDAAERFFFLTWLIPTSAMLLAGALGGFVLARWGDRCGRREAAEASGLVALFAIVLSWARIGVTFASAFALLVVVPGAVFGASLGRHLRTL
jgi:hypothetical protein